MIDKNDRAHISHYDATATALKLAVQTNTGWVNQIVDNGRFDWQVAAVIAIVMTVICSTLGLALRNKRIAVSKDVEGLHPFNAGLLAQSRPRFVPSTPLAGLEMFGAGQ